MDILNKRFAQQGKKVKNIQFKTVKQKAKESLTTASATEARVNRTQITTGKTKIPAADKTTAINTGKKATNLTNQT